MTNRRRSGGATTIVRRPPANDVAEAASTESTGTRKVLLQDYASAVREMRSGRFSVELPGARDSALHQLGEEIGALAEDLESRFERLARLSQIAADVNSGLVLEDVLERVYESFRGIIPYSRIGCALIDNPSWTLRARWARSEAAEPCIGAGYEQSLSGSSLETIISTGRPRIIGDLCDYQRQHPDSDSTRRIVREGMRSSLTCPLVARGRPIGFLFFSSVQAQAYDAEHARTFEEIAEQLSVVVEKSLLYESLHTLNAQLAQSHAQLEHMSSHDATTGLPNRSAVESELARALARATRDGGRVGLLMIDIDCFKQINDRSGHPAGDAVLRGIGQALARTIRVGEVVGRYGGDEFVAVLENCTGAALEVAAERLRRAVSEADFCFEGAAVPVTLSIGGALAAPGKTGNATQIMADADRALYAAKAAGRDRVVIAKPGAIDAS
jgi:diguanylate cyclase (GGDEF)-like protein